MEETLRESIEQIAVAINNNFSSPNVADKNLENANIVDVLGRIGDGLFAIARAINDPRGPD